VSKFKGFRTVSNVVEATYIWLLKGTSFASLIRNKVKIEIPPSSPLEKVEFFISGARLTIFSSTPHPITKKNLFMVRFWWHLLLNTFMFQCWAICFMFFIFFSVKNKVNIWCCLVPLPYLTSIVEKLQFTKIYKSLWFLFVYFTPLKKKNSLSIYGVLSIISVLQHKKRKKNSILKKNIPHNSYLM